MNNLKTKGWIMTELPIRTQNVEGEKMFVPILPVPIALKFIGLSRDGKYLMFHNMIEEELQLYYHQLFKHYYVVRIENTEILRVIFKRGLNEVIWIIEKDISTKYIEDISDYEKIVESYFEDRDVQIAEITGVFLENKTPKEVDIDDEDNYNLDYSSYLALKQNSKFKEYFSDFLD